MEETFLVSFDWVKQRRHTSDNITYIVKPMSDMSDIMLMPRNDDVYVLQDEFIKNIEVDGSDMFIRTDIETSIMGEKVNLFKKKKIC